MVKVPRGKGLEDGMTVRVLFGALVIALLALGPVSACNQPAEAAALRQGLTDWINQMRRDGGLGALRDNAALQTAASGHACDMAKRNFFAHEGPGGPAFGSRIKRTGYRFKRASENIAKTSAAAVSSVATVWRDSSLHWANIMDSNVRDLGIGIAQGNGRTYWVMNVGRPKG